MDEQQFVHLLESLLEPDNERIKAATATLNKNYYTSPGSLSALLHILTSHQTVQLRQLAAVEGRKLVSKHWKAIPADQKAQIRNTLLQSTLNEENKLVRHSAARVVSAVARQDFEDGEWTELPGILQQAANSGTVRHREVGMYIIYTLMETLGDFFMENLTGLFQLFSKTIRDPESSEVRINTMLTLSRVAMFLDTDEDPESLGAFQECIPYMVLVLKGCIDDEDEANAMQAFEVFQTLLGCDATFLTKHFGDLVKFMMDISTQTSIDDEYRSQALAFLMQSARYRKLKIQGLRLGEEMTLRALSIVPELGDGSSEEDEVTPARSALGLLDILASSLPPSQVVVPLLKAIGPYVANQDRNYRRAGILALGMCVEGAPDFIATQLKEILPMVLQLLEDPDIKVRGAALNGVARLSDDLAEDVGKEHARLIPAMMKNFDLAMQSLPSSQGSDREENFSIIRASCSAVDAMIEGLNKEEAAVYVSELVPRFSPLFSSEDVRSQVAAVCAVGAIASASEKAFMPYFESTMQALGEYIPKKESEDELNLRGVVCDSMGKIASAVGPEPFKPYVGPLMGASEEALHLDHPRLRETSYMLWSTMSRVYEEEFSNYLEGVVKGLLECLKQDETEAEFHLGLEAQDLDGQEVSIGGKKFKVVANDDEDEDETIELGDDDDFEDVDPVTAVAMEKEIAIEVIGDVLTHTKAKFMPYLEETIAAVLSLVEHSYEGVRKSSVGTLWRAYACVWGLAEGGGMEKWKPGVPLQVQPPAEIRKLGLAIMTATLGVWSDEMDRGNGEKANQHSDQYSNSLASYSSILEGFNANKIMQHSGTVTDINRDIATTLKLCGPSILVTKGSQTCVDQIVNQLMAILTKRHPCQQDLGAEELEEEILDESSEYDWLVVDTALDCVVSLATALGPAFGELWKVFEKIVIKHASSQEAAERCAAVGCISECVNYMESACTPYTEKLMMTMIRRLSDEDPDTKANAMYGAGLLCEKSDNVQETTRNYNTILSKLEPVLQDGAAGEGGKRLLDNAAGCVGRMIRRHPDKVPLEEVLPRLVELLPVKEDYQENAPAFRCIISLYQNNNPAMRSLTPQMEPILQQVMGPPEEQLDDETREQLVQLVEFLRNQH
ncbi:ARM repeat-containing protein [Tothia fuscella]|uniref:ARM repeat-containing protein n=1 Tax=Tothia fuscella TaxID=1048955 RepID=A0A9P4NIP8_9PEZI|nr:ARM repeat-containing protein [Tothia fuscella]